MQQYKTDEKERNASTINCKVTDLSFTRAVIRKQDGRTDLTRNAGKFHATRAFPTRVAPSHHRTTGRSPSTKQKQQIFCRKKKSLFASNSSYSRIPDIFSYALSVAKRRGMKHYSTCPTIQKYVGLASLIKSFQNFLRNSRIIGTSKGDVTLARCLKGEQ